MPQVRWFLSVLFLSCLLVCACSTNAFAAGCPEDPQNLGAGTTPAFVSPNLWVPLQQQGLGLTDPLGDGKNQGRDVVGDDGHPALFTYSDASYLYFRIRVDEAPYNTANCTLVQFAWAAFIDTTNPDCDGVVLSGGVQAGTFEWVLVVQSSGSGDNLSVQRWGNPTANDWNLFDKVSICFGLNCAGTINVRVERVIYTDGFGGFGGTPDYYLDVRFPWSIFPANPDLQYSTMCIVTGTSSNGQSISDDIAGCVEETVGRSCTQDSDCNNGTITAPPRSCVIPQGQTTGQCSCQNALSDPFNPTCTNGQQDHVLNPDNSVEHTETDVDCGGDCPGKCDFGKGCTTGADCKSAICGTGQACIDAGFSCPLNGHSTGVCLVCQPGETRCSSDGGSIETCRTDGGGHDSQVCADGLGCVSPQGGTPQCRICTPKAKRCGRDINDDPIQETCNDDGTAWVQSQSCAFGCNATTFDCNACTPDSIACNGSNLDTCNGDGTQLTSTPCTHGCNSSANPDSCYPECNPTTDLPRCKPTDSGVRQTCESDGTWKDSPCAFGCNTTTKLCNVCTPNSATCNGDTLVTCKADGSGTTDEACAHGCNTTKTPNFCNPDCNPTTDTTRCKPGESDTLQSCLTDGTRLDSNCPTGCTDATVPPACGCRTDSDCPSNFCVKANPTDETGSCAPPKCDDKLQNGFETDLDCGGPQCRAEDKLCENTKNCQIDGDCQSSFCKKANTTDEFGICADPACDDLVQNGDETDLDCGGPKCRAEDKLCDTGKTCKEDGDCKSSLCEKSSSTDETGTCASVNCTDGKKDRGETDVDCGGACPTKCETDEGCKVGADCVSGVCTTAGTCAAPSCSDGVKNGDETDLDCGGSCPNKCKTGEGCNGDVDCISDLCDTDKGVCLPHDECVDGRKNNTESDIDCGGDICAKCEDGKTCNDHSDCKSGNCSTDTGRCFSYCPDAVDPTDCDGDGIPNVVEDKNRNGVKDPDEWDWNNSDTDADGLPDGVEDANKNGVRDPGETNPLVPDTDGDGMLDGQEDRNKNGVVDKYETDPRVFNQLRVAGGGPKACSVSRAPVEPPLGVALVLFLLAVVTFRRLRRASGTVDQRVE